MSWRTAGTLISGPPSASQPTSSGPSGPAGPTGSSSSSAPLGQKFRPNLGGLTAFQRERQLAAHYRNNQGGGKVNGRTEWDVLRENHRFVRDDEEAENVSWEERLARAYESKLFKEFALVDLKHYKSKRFALRWRTAPEVVEGIGDETCGSLRCRYHRGVPTRSSRPSEIRFGGEEDDDDDDEDEEGRDEEMPRLRAFELPFVYEEGGERKETLVKVRLCGRCQRKLMWKPGEEGRERDREKERNSGRKRDRERDRDRRDDRESRRNRERDVSRGEKERREVREQDRDRDRREDRRESSRRHVGRDKTRYRDDSDSRNEKPHHRRRDESHSPRRELRRLE